MAKGDYYFPVYYKRLLASTVGWKDDEFGAYFRLLIYQFDNGSIPADLDELKRITPSVKKHWPLISKKFHDDGNGGLINDVMHEIYTQIQEKKKKNSDNGKLGGRKKQTVNHPVSDRLTERVSETEAIPITNNQQPIIKEKEDTSLVIYSIEHCLEVAMNDQRWVSANKTSKDELEEFNRMLERRSVYDKNPLDYKTHFANWKAKGKKDEPSATIKSSGPKLSSIVKQIEDELQSK